MQPYRKAIAAILAAIVTILSGFGVNASQWATPEIIASVSSVVGAALVYWLPNKEQ